MEGERARSSPTLNFLFFFEVQSRREAQRGMCPCTCLILTSVSTLLRTRRIHVQAAAGFRNMRDKMKSSGHELKAGFRQKIGRKVV